MKKHFFSLLVLVFTLSFWSSSFAQENPVTIKVEAKKISATEYDIVFNATIEEGWHVYSINQTAADGPNPARFTFTKSTDYDLIGKVKEGKPVEEFDKVFEMKVLYFEHKATFTQRIKLKAEKTIQITGKYEYQTCTNEKCIFPPAKKFSIEIKGTETGSMAPDTINKDVAVKDSFIQPIATATPVAESSVATTAAAKSDNMSCDTPWWLILLKGIGFGLAALITPCVFPMIPMNVSFFLKRNKKRSSAIREALFFMLSIVIIYTALGLLITAVFGVTALNAIASSASFNLIFFALLIVFGVSFLGAFEIVLPSRWVNKMDSQSDRGGWMGIFFMATTLSLVSFSCTSIFIGNLLTVVTDCPSGPLFGFLGFGFGFALPFGLFAIVPSWLQSMPKSGGWLNTVKVTLGLLEIALALKFASNADIVYDMHILTREVFLTLWIILFAITGIYLMGWIKLSHDTPMEYLSIPRLFFAILAFAFSVYMIPGLWGAPLKLLSGITPPTTYSEWQGSQNTLVSTNTNSSSALAAKMIAGPQGLKVFHNDYESALAYAKEVKKPLMIDFTGKVCANCRKMEEYVWVDPEIKNILANEVVIVSLFVDDRTDLPAAEQKEVEMNGDKVLLETEGNKWAFFQVTKYKISSQPYYVMLDQNEVMMNASGIGYDTGREVAVFKNWLNAGIKKFKEKNP